MEIKQTIKYRISFSMDNKVEGVVDKYIPYASYYRGHSIICDTEELAIEYVKHITEKIISANIMLINHPIDRVVNMRARKVGDFTTHSNINWSGLKGSEYDFDVRSEYYGNHQYKSLLTIKVVPHYVTMVTE